MEHRIRILDIDLDLFLDDRKIHGDPKERPTDKEYIPWTVPEIKFFLEAQCGLSAERPTPGAVFVEHDELFDHLSHAIRDGATTPPFELIHADAHADLGMGGGAVNYVCCELLHRSLPDRAAPKRDGRDGLNAGSWLLFAIACRWISSITYVHHPSLTPGERGDIAPSIMRDNKYDTGAIQLKRYPKAARAAISRMDTFRPIAREPTVRLQFIQVNLYRNESPYERVFLTHSPGYTPLSADPLIDVIRSYIEGAAGSG